MSSRLDRSAAERQATRRAHCGSDVLRVTEEMADAAVEAAFPGGVALVAKAAGIIKRMPPEGEKTWAFAVVITLAADARLIQDEWATQLVLQLGAAVPGLLDDLLQARDMAARLDPDSFGSFLAASCSWPAAPVRVLRALVVLRPDFAPVLAARARHLGRLDPSNREHQEGNT